MRTVLVFASAILAAASGAQAMPHSVISALRSDLGDVLVSAIGNPGAACRDNVPGVCGHPNSCSASNRRSGFCNGGWDNVCCVDGNAPAPNNNNNNNNNNNGNQDNTGVGNPGDPGAACKNGIQGQCGLPSVCSQGSLVSGACNGGADNVCCAVNNGNNNNGNNGNGNGDGNAPVLPSNFNVPLLPTSGAEGQLNGKCLQGQPGVCLPQDQCNTSGGYRIQRGRCAGQNYCCTPRNANTNGDVIPDSFFEQGKFCYPIKSGSLAHTGSDFGNGRPRSSNPQRRNKRCHAGQDLFTKSPGTVLAIADGVVTYISNSFLTCRSGWGIRQFHGGRPQKAGAIYVYHREIDRTINYGEADTDTVRVRVNSSVSKGQVLTRASVCGMMHFEMYRGRRSSNLRWWGSAACSRAQGYNCPTPPRAHENNYCAKYSMATKPDAILDPRPYLELLQKNQC